MKKLGLFLLICGLLGIAGMASADTTIFSENFDTLNLGSLNGQNGWYSIVSGSENVFQVQNDIFYQGGQAINATSSPVNAAIVHDITPLSQGIATAYIRYDSTNAAPLVFGIRTTNARITRIIMRALYNEIVITDKYHPNGNEEGRTILGNSNPQTWFKVDIEWKNGLIRGRYNDGTWSEWLEPENSFTDVERVYIGAGTGYGIWNAYIDDISVKDTTPPPPPPPPPPSGQIITLPVASSSDMLAATGTLFSDLWLIIALFISIPLVFVIIPMVIDLVPADEKKRR